MPSAALAAAKQVTTTYSWLQAGTDSKKKKTIHGYMLPHFFHRITEHAKEMSNTESYPFFIDSSREYSMLLVSRSLG